MREKRTHEDDLINHRIPWLFVSQTLLFTAYGFFNNINTNNPSIPVNINTQHLIYLLPYVGLIVSTLIAVGIIAACMAMGILKRYQNDLDPMMRLDVSGHTTTLGQIVAIGLPVLFVIIWSILIFWH